MRWRCAWCAKYQSQETTYCTYCGRDIQMKERNAKGTSSSATAGTETGSPLAP